ncbi:MAG: hypothetical protein J0I00_18880, partial [Burkholderiales bacterium]|nr:hypothetical protein [Burkholderiales bacterium]
LVWVTQNTLRCPPSKWNAVRHHRGTVSAMTVELCPPSAWNRVRHRVEYARAIENEVRAQLQVRIAVHILEPGSLPQSAYKNSLIAVRADAPASSSET